MSIEALNWAFKATGIKSGPKFLLVALANYADDTNTAYPAIDTLMKATNQGRRTVVDGLAILESEGLIEKVIRGGFGAGRESNQYRLLIGQSAESARGLSAESAQRAKCEIRTSNVQNPHGQCAESRTEPLPLNSLRSLRGVTEEKVTPEITPEARKELLTPEGVDPDAWRDFDAHRNSTQKLRASWKQRAQTIAANKLRTLPPEQQRACVEYSILGGYPGLYPEKCREQTHQSRNRNHSAADRNADFFAGLQAIAAQDAEGLGCIPVCQTPSPLRQQDVFPVANAGDPGDGGGRVVPWPSDDDA